MTLLEFASTGPGTLFAFLLGLLVLAQLYLLLIALELEEERRAVLPRAALFLAEALVFSVASASLHAILDNGDTARLPGSAALLSAPVWVYALVAALVLLWEVWDGLRLRQLRRTRLSSLSVKESLDLLPAGIAFAREDGTPMLVNLRMEAVCRAALGTPFRDAGEVWRRVASERLPESSGDEPVLRYGQGQFAAFRRTQLEGMDPPCVQILALDRTEEYAMSRELTERNAALKALGERMSAYGRMVDELTREREILEAKIAVHDGVGQALLAARAYINDPERHDAETVLELWRGVNALLSGTAEPAGSGEDAFRNLTEAAAAFGVEIRLEGELPERGPGRECLITALHECITNTLRHARGSVLWVRLQREAGETVAVFSNNGVSPEGPVRETGGLALLRQRTEAIGGTMTVESEPAFRLILRVPGTAETRGEEKDGR